MVALKSDNVEEVRLNFKEEYLQVGRIIEFDEISLSLSAQKL